MWLECGPGERQGLLNQLAFRATLAHEVQQLITIHRRLAAKVRQVQCLYVDEHTQDRLI
jgi:hypothetical protein